MLWLAVVLFLSLSIAIAWRASRSTESGLDYWTAGGSLSTSSVGLSISAGFMSVSWSCVYAVQLFYGYGLGAIWLITIPWLLALGGMYVLARRFRGLALFSQPEMVRERFGRATSRTVAVAIMFVFLVWGGAEIYVAATLLGPGLGLTVDTTIIGISAIVGLYASFGGFRAVVATDRLQFVVVAFYIVAMAWLALRGLALQNAAPSAAWSSLMPPREVAALKTGSGWLDLAGPGLATIVLTFIAYLPGWLFETDLWLRIQAARSDRAARRGMILAGANAFLFVGVLPLVIGVAALVLFPPENGLAPAAVGAEGDAVFAALVTRFAPGWLSFLIAIGLVAAAMSTIDTCANVVGLSIAYDLAGLHRKRVSPSTSKWVTAAVMAGLCLFALNTESLWDLFYLSGGILTTSVAFPVAATVLGRVSTTGVFWSALAGLSGTATAYGLEAAQVLQRLEPTWLAETGLGFILWGLLAAAAGYAAGALKDARFPGQRLGATGRGVTS